MRFTDDPKQNARILQSLRDKEEKLVQIAHDLAEHLRQVFIQEEGQPPSEKKNKERQIRNIQEVAEQSTSWAEIELFIRYQAARKEIYADWAVETLNRLKDLENMAKSIVQGAADSALLRRVHLYLVRRVLGYTVRWHVWHAKGEPQLQGGAQ